MYLKSILKILLVFSIGFILRMLINYSYSLDICYINIICSVFIFNIVIFIKEIILSIDNIYSEFIYYKQYNKICLITEDFKCNNVNKINNNNIVKLKKGLGKVTKNSNLGNTVSDSNISRNVARNNNNSNLNNLAINRQNRIIELVRESRNNSIQSELSLNQSVNSNELTREHAINRWNPANSQNLVNNQNIIDKQNNIINYVRNNNKFIQQNFEQNVINEQDTNNSIRSEILICSQFAHPSFSPFPQGYPKDIIRNRDITDNLQINNVRLAPLPSLRELNLLNDFDNSDSHNNVNDYENRNNKSDKDQ